MALQWMSPCSGVSRADVAVLERLEQQFKDADEDEAVCRVWI